MCTLYRTFDSFRVKKLDNSKIYALKETNVRKMNQEERADAVNEIRLLASVRDQHIITYHEAFIDGNRLCIIMEYAANGDLARAIRRRASQCRPFPEDLIWSYFIQIVRALQALHSKRILHRDVKSGNVLRVDEGTVKLGDLGIAKLMKHNMTKTQIGTPHYMPPEVWRNRPYSFSSDIWSLGCLLYELCTFNVPFPARDMKDLRFKVLKGKINPIPRVYSSDLSQMIRFLMQPNASDRPSADEILSFDVIQRRMHLAPETSEEKKDNLLNTIKVPKNFRLVAKRLPKPFYPDENREPDDENFNTAASWPRRAPDEHLPPIDARSAVSSPGQINRNNPSTESSPQSVMEVQSKQRQIIDHQSGQCNHRYHQEASLNAVPSHNIKYPLQQQHGGIRRSYDASGQSNYALPASKLVRMSYDNHHSFSHHQHQPGSYFPWNNPISQVSAAAAEAACRMQSNSNYVLSKHANYRSSSSPTYANSPDRIRVPVAHNQNHRYKRVMCPLPPISQGHEPIDSRFYKASIY